jgi:hypothetical protein
MTTPTERSRYFYNPGPRVIISPAFNRLRSSPPLSLAPSLSPSRIIFSSPKLLHNSPVPAAFMLNPKSRTSSEERRFRIRNSNEKLSPNFQREISEKLSMLESQRSLTKFKVDSSNIYEENNPEVTTGARDRKSRGSPRDNEKEVVKDVNYFLPFSNIKRRGA